MKLRERSRSYTRRTPGARPLDHNHQPCVAKLEPCALLDVSTKGDNIGQGDMDDNAPRDGRRVPAPDTPVGERGAPTKALLYTATIDNPNFYLSPTAEEAADVIASAVGPSGPNHEYLFLLSEYLQQARRLIRGFGGRRFFSLLAARLLWLYYSPGIKSWWVHYCRIQIRERERKKNGSARFLSTICGILRCSSEHLLANARLRSWAKD